MHHDRYSFLLGLLVLLGAAFFPASASSATCAGGVRYVTVELIDSAPVANDDTARREHVFVSADLMDMIAIDDDFTSGSRVNPQIRVEIESPSIDGYLSNAVFTVAGVIETFPIRHIRVYRKLNASDKNSGEHKLFQDNGTQEVNLVPTYGNGGIYGVDARVNSIAVSKSYITSVAGTASTREYFCENGGSSHGFTETAVVTADDRLAVIAPHGGGVEAPTDEQAADLVAELDGVYGIEPSRWWTEGAWGNGQTLPRWHTTATEIDPVSFPGLRELFDLPDEAPGRPFQYAVALHGYGDSSIGLILGGRADRLDQCLVAKRIQDELVAVGQNRKVIGLRIHSVGHSDLAVANTASYTPPDDHAGHLEENLVNRLSPNPSSVPGFGGLQLEQSKGLRDNATLLGAVTRGVARALDELLALGTPADHCSALP